MVVKRDTVVKRLTIVKMRERKHSNLDFLVIFFYALAFLQVIVNMLWFDREAAIELRDQSALLSYVNNATPMLVVFVLSSILTWMIYGGAKSLLWKWLPPFCFFFWCNTWQRWVLVILIVLSTLLAMVQGALGIL